MQGAQEAIPLLRCAWYRPYYVARSSTRWRTATPHSRAARPSNAHAQRPEMLALSQSWVLEVKSENRISENQWLASFNFPVFGSLRQSPRNCAALFVTHDLEQHELQVTGTERFATKPRKPQRTRFVSVHHMAEPGAQDNRYVWANPPQFSCQLFAGQVGHGLIRNDHVELLRRGPKRLKGLHTTRTCHDIIAQPCQHRLTKVRQGCFVIHKQNAPLSMMPERLVLRRLHAALLETRQIDGKRGALAHGALNAYCPLVRGNNPMHHRQAKACPYSDAFGSKERLEHALEDVWSHTVARIPDCKPDMRPWGQGLVVGHENLVDRDSVQADLQQPSGLPHRMFGVGTEVQEDLVHLGWVGEHSSHLRGQVRADLDGGGEGGPQEPEHFQDQPVHMEGAAFRAAVPAKGQNLLYQVFSPLPSAEDVLQLMPGLALGGHIVQGKFGIAQDRAQDIVEIMGNTACQSPQGFQLLGLL